MKLEPCFRKWRIIEKMAHICYNLMMSPNTNKGDSGAARLEETSDIPADAVNTADVADLQIVQLQTGANDSLLAVLAQDTPTTFAETSYQALTHGGISYEQVTEDLRDDENVDRIFDGFLTERAEKIQSAIQDHLNKMNKLLRILQGNLQDSRTRFGGPEETRRSMERRGKSEAEIRAYEEYHAQSIQSDEEGIAKLEAHLAQLEESEQATPDVQCAILFGLTPPLTTTNKRTLLSAYSYMASREAAETGVQSVHHAKMRIMLERGIGPDGKLLPEGSGVPDPFFYQRIVKTVDDHPIRTLFHDDLPQRWAVNRVSMLYQTPPSENPRRDFYQNRLQPAMEEYLGRQRVNTTQDPDPYSKGWQQQWENGDRDPKNQQLRERLNGRIVIDIFGGEGSIMESIAEDCGADWYVNEDLFAFSNLGDSPFHIWHNHNQHLGKKQPEHMQVDYYDKEGLTALSQLPTNAEGVVIVLNGVDFSNINYPALHENLAWEIVRVLPEEGAVLCREADASEHFKRLGLELAPGFSDTPLLPQMWIKPKGHVLDKAQAPTTTVPTYGRYAHRPRW